MIRTLLAVLLLLAAPAGAQRTWPTTEGDYIIRDFKFGTGEPLSELRLHYTTLGTPQRDGKGHVTNAIMVLHGTGGSGKQFLQPQFAEALYGPGQPLDLARWYIVLPDSIGHGGSSKPSDGLKAKFPRYAYADMVAAQHRLLTEHLKVNQLRLLMGTSMGCMHSFVWGVTWPGFARAMMPTACLTVEIAGRNRQWRKLAMDAIRADPAYRGGDYTAQPLAGLRTAQSLLLLAGSAPLRQQRDAPTRAAADAALDGGFAPALAGRDANDLIWQLDSSRDYNPSPLLTRITVPVRWINSEDDFINPPGLRIAEAEVQKMPRATFRLIPETTEGRGHGSHSWAQFWKPDLVAILAN